MAEQDNTTGCETPGIWIELRSTSAGTMTPQDGGDQKDNRGKRDMASVYGRSVDVMWMEYENVSSMRERRVQV